MQDFLTAIALLLILEGIMPFLSPANMRRILVMVMNVSDRALRVSGLAAMLLGIALLYGIR